MPREGFYFEYFLFFLYANMLAIIGLFRIRLILSDIYMWQGGHGLSKTLQPFTKEGNRREAVAERRVGGEPAGVGSMLWQLIHGVI